MLEAVSFGWIDGKVRARDEHTFAQRFTPRKPNSIWAESNKARVAQLIDEGRMTPAGMVHVEAAKKDGRWDNTWTAKAPAEIPADLEKALRVKGDAWDKFSRFAPSYRNNYLYWIEDAKRDETRQRRIAEVVERSAKGLKPGV